jgi:site-specific recombinase XerD
MPSSVAQFAHEHFTLNSISEPRRLLVLLCLRQLQEHAGMAPEQVTDRELRAWLASLLAQGFAPSTVYKQMWAVRPFFRWAWESARIIDGEQYMRIRAVKAPRGSHQSLPRPYTRKQIALMWAQLDAKYPRLPAPRVSPATGWIDGRVDLIGRWRRGITPYRVVKRHFMRVQLEAIIELALVCGLRHHEIYSLTVDDVHFDNKYILVHGKRTDQNERLRDVPYPSSTRAVMREWLTIRALLDATTSRVWLSVTGPVPNAEMIPQRMNGILHCFGPWDLHRLRHTCATERLRAGMKLEQLSRFLGHSRITQTLGYAQLVRSDVHEDAERIDAQFQRAIRPAA